MIWYQFHDFLCLLTLSMSLKRVFIHPNWGFFRALLVNDIDDAVDLSKEEFVNRFRGKYTDEEHLPMWMVTEVMSFGQLYTIFRNLQRNEQQNIALQFKLFPPVLDSWLHTINFVRNVCAHHGRLWNREISIKPALPNERHNPEWYYPVPFRCDRVFVVLTIISYLLDRIDPKNDWQKKVINLLTDFSDVPKRSMGFPDNWQDSPLWKSSRS